MSSELRASENPRKWRFTWEAQSHIPTLKLFLFNPNTKPSILCKNLKVELVLEQYLLRVSWSESESESESEVLLGVPLPRVLIDAESPVQFRALDDHVEVKLVLLLPVDHPIVANFDSVLSLSEGESNRGNTLSDDHRVLSMDSDLQSLSSMGGVRFYCRSCSTQLTRSLRFFAELPSTDWREVADNWFGACCCSFGGISEKLVTSYANSYTSAAGMCLLSTTLVVLCKDDLVGCKFPCSHRNQKCESEADFNGHDCLTKTMPDYGCNHGRLVCCDNKKGSTLHFNGNLSCSDPEEDSLTANLECQVFEKVINGKKDDLSANLECQVFEKVINGENSSCMFPALEFSKCVLSASGCCGDSASLLTRKLEDCLLETSGTSSEQTPTTNFELLANQKSLLNGFLGDVFMAKPSYLSKEVRWVEFLCPQCSCLLGAYPSGDGHAPLDGGIRLFKCYISTCLPVGGSKDLVRKYSLEKMFTNQLLENAEHELSFRTVVRDLQTGSAMLQIVLLNSNSFHCNSYCFGTDNKTEPVGKVDLFPAIKVLFLDCSSCSESQLRMIEEWVTKKQADEVYMLAHQIKELTKCLDSGQDMFPLSHTFLQGLSLSSMRR
ncbi:hypothetical protein HYC85_002192 [Camellia sinensis]|uniref:Ubiquitin-conjugating enzyme E2C-binding protein n=1 Tax=Camellia sinensis TaxID=4442 RepID=A0A7J7I7J1_CAMSI|nr:hypothetical protein HYC85_002192 [Camellia sinensis]